MRLKLDPPLPLGDTRIVGFYIITLLKLSSSTKNEQILNESPGTSKGLQQQFIGPHLPSIKVRLFTEATVRLGRKMSIFYNSITRVTGAKVEHQDESSPDM